ncbi:SDR family NAD(P)-dependent oxidoreductase [Sphingomonas sp.]|uniref:SDR family NAD(P)-dependent oxidoreductase n=1 Tax=Sphingomonas sp. TaxID=28214 RepID=UPI003AFF8132
MPTMMIFGLGYTAGRLADHLRGNGWTVLATRRDAGGDAMAFADEAAVLPAIAAATHILSSVPPADGGDPVLARYQAAIAAAGARWIGYLSSTGVYGDAGGAWVDEGTPLAGARVAGRTAADLAWRAAGARILRLPGIYGPGRSALDRVREGKAHRVAIAGQVFSRVHVDDIVDGIVAAFDAPPGAYNLADDQPTSQNAVVEEAARLLRVDAPPIVGLDTLSPMARSFYAENRRVANGRAKRVLGWRPRFADYRAGLADCLARSATASPASAAAQPSAASHDQR